MKSMLYRYRAFSSILNTPFCFHLYKSAHTDFSTKMPLSLSFPSLLFPPLPFPSLPSLPLSSPPHSSSLLLFSGTFCQVPSPLKHHIFGDFLLPSFQCSHESLSSWAPHPLPSTSIYSSQCVLLKRFNFFTLSSTSCRESSCVKIFSLEHGYSNFGHSQVSVFLQIRVIMI